MMIKNLLIAVLIGIGFLANVCASSLNLDEKLGTLKVRMQTSLRVDNFTVQVADSLFKGGVAPDIEEFISSLDPEHQTADELSNYFHHALSNVWIYTTLIYSRPDGFTNALQGTLDYISSYLNDRVSSENHQIGLDALFKRGASLRLPEGLVLGGAVHSTAPLYSLDCLATGQAKIQRRRGARK